MAGWIIERMPQHRVYVEPFAGSAAVLLQKPRVRQEVYNDLSSDVVTFFCVLRDGDMRNRLIESVELTPFARLEHFAARDLTDDPVEQARRFLVRCHMGFGGDANRTTGFAHGAHDGSNTSKSQGWRSLPAKIRAVAERMQGVVIESRPAQDLLPDFDSEQTLYYVDPPYLHSTRVAPGAYAVEMTDADHESLLVALRDLRGSVLLSGYDSDLYRDVLHDWRAERHETFGGGARGAVARTEVLWSSPATVERLRETTADMFGLVEGL